MTGSSPRYARPMTPKPRKGQITLEEATKRGEIRPAPPGSGGKSPWKPPSKRQRPTTTEAERQAGREARRAAMSVGFSMSISPADGIIAGGDDESRRLDFSEGIIAGGDSVEGDHSRRPSTTTITAGRAVVVNLPKQPTAWAGRKFLTGSTRKTIALVQRSGALHTQSTLDKSLHHLLRMKKHAELDDAYVFHNSAFYPLDDKAKLKTATPPKLKDTPPTNMLFIRSTGIVHRPEPKKSKRVDNPSRVTLTDAELAIDNVDPKRPIGLVELIAKQDTRYNTPHRARVLQGGEVLDERENAEAEAEAEDVDGAEDEDGREGEMVAAAMFTKVMFGQATTLPPSLRNAPAQQRYLAGANLAVQAGRLMDLRRLIDKAGNGEEGSLELAREIVISEGK